jgi:uncharacterized protein
MPMSRPVSISGTCSNLTVTLARPPARALRLLAVLLALLLAAFAGGTAGASGPTYPALTGRVVDNADMLPPADEAALTQRLEALQRATSRQLVIATVPDMGGYEIEEYANGLFRQWQLGQRTANNGVLLLVARSEKKVRIETGYNMEAIVTDALSGRIIREQIVPRFRANDFAGGIKAGADALLAQLQAPPEAAEQAAVQAQQAENGHRSERRRSNGGSPFALFFWIGVTLFIVIGLIGSGLRGTRYRGRRRGWGGPIVLWGPGWGGGGWGRRNRGWDDWGSGGGWGGGSWGGGGGGSSWGGGGGFSGGGGSSGGGGASGGW